MKKPDISAIFTFDTCIAGITTTDLRQRLQDIRDTINSSETELDEAASTSKVHLIAPKSKIGQVTAKEMENLYDRHMVRGKSRGRSIYDRLLIAAENDTCPFCGHRTVSTLDHFLPKASHPALAVTPINLIPSCMDCNHTKGTRSPADIESTFLNAYYDDVTSERWLYARVVQGSPPAATFFIRAPDQWDEKMAKRVANHFIKLRLGNLYASQAGRQFQNMRRALREIHAASGVEAVRKDLERRFRSCNEVMKNSWESALYDAAATSDWYCDGGFEG